MSLRPWIALPAAVASLAAASCSSTKVRAIGDDVLVVEHRGATDAVASTWTLDGAWDGAVTPAEDLEAMEVAGLVGTDFGAESVDPRRDLQGRIDRSQPGEVLFSIRRRGLSRWSELPFNGVHRVGPGSPQTIDPEAMRTDAGEARDGGGLSWNPMNWFAGDDEGTELPPPEVAAPQTPAGQTASEVPPEREVGSDGEIRWQQVQAAENAARESEPDSTGETDDRPSWGRRLWPW